MAPIQLRLLIKQQLNIYSRNAYTLSQPAINIIERTFSERILTLYPVPPLKPFQIHNSPYWILLWNEQYDHGKSSFGHLRSLSLSIIDNSNKVSVEGSPICLAINQICKNGILTEQKVKHLITYLPQTLTDLDETWNNVMQATLW